MLTTRTLFPALAALLGLASAQVTTDCNPMERDDCKPNPAFGTSQHFNFNSTPNGALWETVVRGVTYDPEKGAAFVLDKQGDSPTIRTKFYFFGGRTDVIMKAAPGKGIVSSMMWLSDNLDEVDWEFIGVNETHASTNWFGKGVEDFRHAGWHEMSPPQNDYHNYSTVWSKDKLEWYIDSKLVRSLLPKDANDTEAYPQTPMRLSLGIWAGGDPSLPEGTRLWAGGDADYDNGPYTMYVKEVYVEDYTTGSKEYVFGDRSGSWDSIEIVKGNSTAYEAMHKEPERTMSEKWEEDVPETAKIAIYAGGAGVGALLLGGLIFYCIKQRRRGAAEAKAAEDRAQTELAEDLRLKRDGIDPDGFREHGQEYNAKEMYNGGNATADAYNVSPSNEKDWSAAGIGAGAGAGAGAAAAAAAAAGGMRSPVPLLRDGAQSPRVGSPGPMSPYHDGPRSPGSPGPGMNGAMGAPYRTQSPGMPQSYSPSLRSQSPAMPPQGALPPIPNQSRASPGPQRMHSPAPMNQARSFSENQAAYGANRMQTASPMNPNRSFSNGQPPYRGPPPQNRDYWNGGGQY